MYVKEFAKGLTSTDLNAQLKGVYKWSLNLNEMTDSQATSVLANMKEKLQKIRESSKGHFAEKNPNYMEAYLVTKVLESLLSEREQQYIMERALKKAEMKKREKYVKGMKKVKGDFEKRYPGRGKEVMYATATKMAKKESVEEAMDVLKGVLAGNMTLLEGEFDQAAAVVAARDMVDTMQDMIEKLSNMLNKDLPALQDVMRNELGQEKADAFAQSANATLNPLMDQIRSARQALDDASRAAAGDETAAPGMGAPGMGAPGMGAPDMGAPPAPEGEPGLSIPPPSEPEADATADSAAGGGAELGRGKRT